MNETTEKQSSWLVWQGVIYGKSWQTIMTFHDQSRKFRHAIGSWPVITWPRLERLPMTGHDHSSWPAMTSHDNSWQVMACHERSWSAMTGHDLLFHDWSWQVMTPPKYTELFLLMKNSSLLPEKALHIIDSPFGWRCGGTAGGLFFFVWSGKQCLLDFWSYCETNPEFTGTSGGRSCWGAESRTFVSQVLV